LLKNARKQKILDLVNHKGYVDLELLSQVLETSESTVRRDLTELDSACKLKRVHGGAESL
jgi:DeoR family fructose operon transcriptional repressor